MMPITFQADTASMDRYFAALVKYPALLDRAKAETIKRWTLNGVRETKQLITSLKLYGPSRTYERSVIPHVTPTEGRYGSWVKYAGYIEKGTDRHPITPVRRKALAWGLRSKSGYFFEARGGFATGKFITTSGRLKGGRFAGGRSWKGSGGKYPTNIIMIIRKSVNHPGTRAYRVFESVFKAMEPVLAQIAQQECQRALASVKP